jgi:hypothetical protein
MTLIINNDNVASVLTMADTIEVLERAYGPHHTRRRMPAAHRHPDSDG